MIMRQERASYSSLIRLRMGASRSWARNASNTEGDTSWIRIGELRGRSTSRCCRTWLEIWWKIERALGGSRASGRCVMEENEEEDGGLSG